MDADKKELLIMFIIVVALLSFLGWKIFGDNKQKTENNNGTLMAEEEIVNPFDNLSIEAKSAFVWDMKEQKALYSLNEEVQLPLASLTKLMTAFVSYELIPPGTIITIKESDLDVEGESGFVLGEKWTLSNILDYTLTTSSNDGAHALASVIGFVRPREAGKTERAMFIDEMNLKSQEMGLVQTFFLSESGLDLNESMSGAYGSAKDMAILMENIIEKEPRILEATRYANLVIKSKSLIYDAENTNSFVESIPGVIGSKTGFTDLAGGNLIVAFDLGIGHPIIVSVLGSSREGRFEDVRKLISASINKVAGK